MPNKTRKVVLPSGLEFEIAQADALTVIEMSGGLPIHDVAGDVSAGPDPEDPEVQAAAEEPTADDRALSAAEVAALRAKSLSVRLAYCQAWTVAPAIVTRRPGDCAAGEFSVAHMTAEDIDDLAEAITLFSRVGDRLESVLPFLWAGRMPSPSTAPPETTGDPPPPGSGD